MLQFGGTQGADRGEKAAEKTARQIICSVPRIIQSPFYSQLMQVNVGFVAQYARVAYIQVKKEKRKEKSRNGKVWIFMQTRLKQVVTGFCSRGSSPRGERLERSDFQHLG